MAASGRTVNLDGHRRSSISAETTETPTGTHRDTAVLLLGTDVETHTHTHTHTQSACCQSHHSLPVSHVDLVPEKTDLYRRLMEDRKWQEVFSMKISCQSNTSVPPPGTAVCTYVIDVDTFIPFYAACSRPQRFHLVILFKTLQHNLLLCFLAKEGNNGAESTPV